LIAGVEILDVDLLALWGPFFDADVYDYVGF